MLLEVDTFELSETLCVTWVGVWNCREEIFDDILDVTKLLLWFKDDDKS